MRKWTVLFAVPMMLCVMVACAARVDHTEGKYLLYVPANSESAGGADAITTVHTDLNVEAHAAPEAKAIAAVERILASGGGRWREIQLQDLSIKNRRVYVDLSPQYARLSGIQLSLIDYCITLSLTQMEEISSVTITANGMELPFRDSQVLMEQDVLLSTMDDVIETVTISLFFVDGSGVLTEEVRTLEMYEGQTLSESMMAALLEGPQEKELNAVIPEGFTFNSIRMEERACILSLPGSALKTLPKDEQTQRVILQSIAQTIYSRDGVDEIRIMVDGEPCTAFGEVPTTEIQFRPMKNQ